MSYGGKYKGVYPTSYNGSYGIGAGISPLLQRYQDRCTRISDTMALQLTNTWFDQNRIIRLVLGIGDSIEMLLPLNTLAGFGSRVIVFNHQEIEVTITGTRQASIEGSNTITTSAPYFLIINDDTNNADNFADFRLITSS